MEKTLCTFSYRPLYIIFIALLMVMGSVDGYAQNSTPPVNKERGGLVIDDIQVFGRPAPYAPWKRVKENGVLYIMNFCTIRVVSKLSFPKKGRGMDDLRETILVEKAGKRRVLVDKKALVDMNKPPDPKILLIYMGGDRTKTILHTEFPCFEDRPDWIKPGTNITLTVIVSSGGRTARKSFSFIYDEFLH